MAVKLRTDVDLLGTQRKLDAVSLGLADAVNDARRRAAEIVVPKARDYVPKTKYPERRGYLAASLYAVPAGVASSVPQGPVHEFGGTIAPRGVPIRIRRSAMAERGGREALPRVNEILREEVDALLARTL